MVKVKRRKARLRSILGLLDLKMIKWITIKKRRKMKWMISSRRITMIIKKTMSWQWIFYRVDRSC